VSNGDNTAEDGYSNHSKLPQFLNYGTSFLSLEQARV